MACVGNPKRFIGLLSFGGWDNSIFPLDERIRACAETHPDAEFPARLGARFRSEGGRGRTVTRISGARDRNQAPARTRD